MKSLKITAIFGAAIFFLLYFAGFSLGFNPQPEPPAKQQMNQPGDDKMQAAPGVLQHQPEPGTPQMMQQTMPGSDKMQEEEEEEPIQAHSPKMMDQGDAGGPGSPKMEEERMNEQMRRY